MLVSPELASVLASVVKRLRDSGNGSVPLVSRYDPHEKTSGPPLPHLFQRKNGWRPAVFSRSLVTRMLNDALARAGITDAAGQPLKYTAHDFRRMFATEAVTGGLPVHIAAKILGHRSLATTETISRLPGRPDPNLPRLPRQAPGHPPRSRVPRTHRPGMARVRRALREAQA